MLPFPSSGDLSDPGTNPQMDSGIESGMEQISPVSPALQGFLYCLSHLGSALLKGMIMSSAGQDSSLTQESGRVGRNSGAVESIFIFFLGKSVGGCFL